MPLIVVFFLILPVVAIAVLVAVRRSARLKPLVPALAISGVTTALATAFLAFTRSSVPIAPYETGPGAWGPVIGGVLIALYVGFGIGVVLATLIGLPYLWIATRRRG
jgi:hypothetical protein